MKEVTLDACQVFKEIKNRYCMPLGVLYTATNQSTLKLNLSITFTPLDIHNQIYEPNGLAFA